MNKFIGRISVIAGALAFVGAAQAITFSNVNITGPAQLIGALGTDHFVNTGLTDIDFTFNKALVGDNLPLQTGTIVITFEAKDVNPFKSVTLSGTGITMGSGILAVQEIIEDFSVNNYGIVGTANIQVPAPDSTPFSKVITLSKMTNHVKIKKTIFLDAPNSDTANQIIRDYAGVGLIEQKIEVVPEPASMAALGLGFAALAARRRRK